MQEHFGDNSLSNLFNISKSSKNIIPMASTGLGIKDFIARSVRPGDSS